VADGGWGAGDCPHGGLQTTKGHRRMSPGDGGCWRLTPGTWGCYHLSLITAIPDPRSQARGAGLGLGTWDLRPGMQHAARCARAYVSYLDLFRRSPIRRYNVLRSALHGITAPDMCSKLRALYRGYMQGHVQGAFEPEVPAELPFLLFLAVCCCCAPSRSLWVLSNVSNAARACCFSFSFKKCQCS
jgi:hypothetical protein